MGHLRGQGHVRGVGRQGGEGCHQVREKDGQGAWRRRTGAGGVPVVRIQVQT